MKKRKYVERRLYYSETCIKCGKPFKSFKRSRIKSGVCKRKTCRYSVPDNQQPLFPAQVMIDGRKDRVTFIGTNDEEQVTTIIGKQDDGSYGISRKVVKK